MKIAKSGLIISLLIATAFAIGCKKSPDSAANTITCPAADIIDTSHLQLVSETEEKERDDFQSSIRATALKGDFQGLESQAQTFRSNKSSFENGFWKLRAFYTAFGDYEKIGDEKVYSDLIGQLERWAAQQPDAITPRLALVEAYHGYAWLARGSGYASQVTDQGESLMEQRMKTGFTWLREAQKLQNKANDPAFYAITLHSFLGANVDRKIYEDVFEAGVKNAPDYSALYEYKAYYLLPRWYGQNGEWETFARQISERKDIPGGEEIFARAALFLRNMGFFYDEFSGDDASWEELKTSFHVIEKNHPNSLEIKSTLCRMSLNMRDYKEAREQMKMLDGKVDLSVWDSQKNFLDGVQWMSQDDAILEASRQQYKANLHRNN
jgi:hypothetical protein